MPLALCFPVHSRDRQRLREVSHHALPAVYPGSVHGVCTRCSMTVWLTSRLMAVPDAVPVCPWCAVQVAGADATITNLRNPDSRFETAAEIAEEIKPKH